MRLSLLSKCQVLRFTFAFAMTIAMKSSSDELNEICQINAGCLDAKM